MRFCSISEVQLYYTLPVLITEHVTGLTSIEEGKFSLTGVPGDTLFHPILATLLHSLMR
jgi:hypothetical protein